MKHAAITTAASLLLCGCMSINETNVAASAAQGPPAPEMGGLQFLYGSAEAAGISRQTYRALEMHALAKAAERPEYSVILARGASVAAPTYVPCEDKPLAIVLDVDETVALNSGLMHGRATGAMGGPGSPLAVRPVPGVVETIRSLERAGITPVYNTNRTLNMSDLVADTIESFGLDRPVQGETLFLNGMDEMGGNKDGRRWTISESWCVVAMAGDQLGDFSEELSEAEPVSARRNLALTDPIAGNWGNGWYLLPNTAYGRALEGDISEVFPEIEGGGE